MTDTEPTTADAGNSTFADRAAERREREAAGEVRPERRRTTLPAGIDEPTPSLVVTHVRQ